jgi:translation initiation factor 2-alpha kinase 4
MSGMAEIHKHCILHRDLKPENIFIGEKEGNHVAKIGDFGLAWMLGDKQRSNCSKNYSKRDSKDDSKSTSTRNSLFSSVAGTEAYMAPEIRTHYRNGTQPPKHRDMQIDMKQDIYSLGLILYEICHKIKTGMQKTQLFRQLDNNREIHDVCPLKKGVHVEYDMILAMTAKDP